MRRFLPLLWFVLLAPLLLRADDPAFDLTGPKVDVRVKRGEVTLPIAEVPNLLAGDRLWIHPDFPASQSAHYVLIVAFLRGVTNPPPPEWFTRVETWSHEAREEGILINVPQEAQQALFFLAPETGGDFSTLRAAVRGRPGAFVRATQDLQAASWDRMRLDTYLAEVRKATQDPATFKDHTERAAHTLGIRLDQQCFDKPSEQQAPCLVQHTEGLVLDDANAQSLVAQLANGSTADLMNQISNSTVAGGGAYSPYVGAIVDTAKILSSLHTAHFQYIPALALPTKDTLNLRLNVPPSFRDPKSVVVVALPPVASAKMPLLHPSNPAESYCAEKPNLVLPAEGAPLVFATELARGLTLHLEIKGAKTASVDLPLKPEPSEGGLVLTEVPPLLTAGELTGVVRGQWGFDNWEGPRFHLFSAQPGGWTVAPSDQLALVVGREDTLHLDGASSLCVEKIDGKISDKPIQLTWKSPKPKTMEIAFPLKDAAPGPVSLEIHQYGLDKPDTLALKAYAEAASLERLTLSSGDKEALLKGKRLDEVAKADLEGIEFTPSTLNRVHEFDQLTLAAAISTATLEAGKSYTASVQLRDGRELKVPVTVEPPRPQVTLLSKGMQDDASAAVSPVRLGSPDDLPLSGRLVFFLQSHVPVNFPRNEDVEVAAADGSFHATLTLADGSLMLEDTKTALGVLEPLARFGPSAFGPIQVRAVSADGATGDWLRLGTLVRLPGFKELHCPHNPAKPCTLTGSNLFLATSFSATLDFDDPADVPPDFTGTQLAVPHPANGVLYLKLRDDPETVQTLTMPVTLPATVTPQPAPQAQPATAPPSATPVSPASNLPPPTTVPQAKTAGQTGAASSSQ